MIISLVCVLYFIWWIVVTGGNIHVLGECFEQFLVNVSGRVMLSQASNLIGLELIMNCNQRGQGIAIYFVIMKLNIHFFCFRSVLFLYVRQFETLLIEYKRSNVNLVYGQGIEAAGL